FSQAEDGIRDRNVTGVQTCALPISRARSGRPARCNSAASVRLTWVLLRWGVRARATKIISYPPQFGERCSAKAARITRRARLRRSEARRVGQEYQWRRIACHER